MWNNWRNSVILFQRKQWFKTQFFIKIIVFEFLKIWLLSFSDSSMMSHLVIIRIKTEQETELSFTITDLFCIMMLIVTHSTVWYANVLNLFNKSLQACCIFLKFFRNAGKIFSVISLQIYLSQKTWMWFLLLLINF